MKLVPDFLEKAKKAKGIRKHNIRTPLFHSEWFLTEPSDYAKAVNLISVYKPKLVNKWKGIKKEFLEKYYEKPVPNFEDREDLCLWHIKWTPVVLIRELTDDLLYRQKQEKKIELSRMIMDAFPEFHQFDVLSVNVILTCSDYNDAKEEYSIQQHYFHEMEEVLSKGIPLQQLTDQHFMEEGN